MPSIRALQAQELIAGPAPLGKKVIVVGDLNSDVPGVQPGDEQAFQTMLSGGFRDVGTTDPLSCCVSNLFSVAAERVRPPGRPRAHEREEQEGEAGSRSKVTGRSPVNGIYDSDHAGRRQHPARSLSAAESRGA